MTKKKIIKRSNRPLNLYLSGGILNTGASAINSVINPKGNTTGIGNALSTVGSAASVIPGVGGIIGAGANLVGGLFNTMFGSKINKDAVNQLTGANTQQYNTVADISSNEGLLSQYGAFNPLDVIQKSQVGSDGWFSKKAKRKTNELNQQRELANERAEASIMRGFGTLDSQNDLDIMANYSANGGALNLFKDGGGIHIKKANRGKFTKYCGGKVTSECIAKGKKSSSPAVRKRATFAANARKWHHADGGMLSTQGGDFSNGVTIIGNGGLHEENPMSGVPMGIAPDGNPNLVEQGEVKFNDYIFSNRLSADKELLSNYKLPTKFTNHTFADIAERVSKESSERPNDPISKRGLMSGMSRLMQAQEDIRSITPNTSSGKKFAKGGLTRNFLSGLSQMEEEAPEDYSSNPQLRNMIAFNSDAIAGGGTPGFGNNGGIGLDALRYAPVVGSGIASLTDAFGLTNKPNYSDADLIGKEVDNINFAPVRSRTIGNYLTYNPLDRDYYLNKLNAQSGATRRSIVNQSGGNRATATAGLLAADYNYGQGLGSMARQAEEYNQAQKERVEGFNRGTNQFNAEMLMKADLANQSAGIQGKELKLKGRLAQAELRTQERTRSAAAKSANLTNFFDNLGAIGQEEFSRNMIQSNPSLGYTIGRSGKISYKNKKSKGGGLTYGK